MKSSISTALRAVAALAVLTALAGCGEGKVYSLSPDAARSALVGSAIPGIAFGEAAHSGPGEATADGVVWTIAPGPGAEGGTPDDGADGELIKLAAKLAPASSGVEITVDVEPPSNGDPKRLAEAASLRPEVFHYFRTVAREQVDSVLTHRAFSFGAVSRDMAVIVAVNLVNIRKRLDEDAAADDQHEKETINHAYDVAGRGSQ